MDTHTITTVEMPCFTHNFNGPLVTGYFNDRAKVCHANNQQWWHDIHTGAKLDRNKGELIMLIVSELAEAMEGERKDLMDTHLPHRKMAEVELADVEIRTLDYAGAFNYDLDSVFCTVAIEPTADNRPQALMDIVNEFGQAYRAEQFQDYSGAEYFIARGLKRTHMYATKFGYDIAAAVAEKHEYNANRADHKRESRLAANGKKF